MECSFVRFKKFLSVKRWFELIAESVEQGSSARSGVSMKIDLPPLPYDYTGK
jgi:hypothetical protein